MTDPRFIEASEREAIRTRLDDGWCLCRDADPKPGHYDLLNHADAADRRISGLEAERDRLQAMVKQLLDCSLVADECIAELEAIIDELAASLREAIEVEAYRKDKA